MASSACQLRNHECREAAIAQLSQPVASQIPSTFRHAQQNHSHSQTLGEQVSSWRTSHDCLEIRSIGSFSIGRSPWRCDCSHSGSTFRFYDKIQREEITEINIITVRTQDRDHRLILIYTASPGRSNVDINAVRSLTRFSVSYQEFPSLLLYLQCVSD